MAKYANTATRILFDQYDVSGFLNSSSLDITQEVAGVDTLGVAGPRRLTGNYDHKSSMGVLFDAEAGTLGAISIDEYIDSLITEATPADHYLTQLFGANAAGSVSYDQIVRLAEKPHKHAVGAAALIDISVEGSGGLCRGLVICNATIGGDGNQTGRNIGASTSGQTFQTVIRVLSGTFTSFDVNVQESSDDAAGDPYATVAALSQTGINAVGVWRKTTTSATEAWKRVSVANWIGTSAVVIVTAGIVAGS